MKLSDGSDAVYPLAWQDTFLPILKQSLPQDSNSQYSKTGEAFGEKAVDVNLAKATSKVKDKLLCRRASLLAENETGCWKKF